ncbi:alpha/beta fold hydrolase [Rivibacter subsaxonicus]|uniref:Haloacetate dehalogenase n=1 Tax=Rivibacter subsaxonicus TaxID=457575 RepID=A0A4Q7VXT7_9BURK|nr:alpha/beta hydrolase [Rivibacter subsaxonicus]RZU01249.1 haloacetate dehalogenase [Rivibacter subsaxonicus]
MAESTWFEGFETRQVPVADGIELFARTGGRHDAPPLLLLHGYPETHALWQRIARRLADRFCLVVPDLRGYGASSKPAGAPDHANYSKRAMATDVLALMRGLGHERFFVAGHDRGGRVAHRLALDHPDAVLKLSVIDIVPTLTMYERTDMAFASAYYHWFYLIQPQPLPEKQIGADPGWYLRWTLSGWGSKSLDYIEPQALADYERGFCNTAGIHAACEDYRAAASIDLEHDRASRAAQQRVQCPLQVLWGERGVVARLFDPLADWRAACDGPVSGRALAAGHFIPEELPEQTAQQLADFFLS